jgi:hypothetical protein
LFFVYCVSCEGEGKGAGSIIFDYLFALAFMLFIIREVTVYVCEIEHIRYVHVYKHTAINTSKISCLLSCFRCTCMYTQSKTSWTGEK